LIDNEADLFVTLPTEQNQSDQLVKVHATEGVNKPCRVRWPQPKAKKALKPNSEWVSSTATALQT